LVEAARTIDHGSFGNCESTDFDALLATRADRDAAVLLIYDTVWCLSLLTERTIIHHGETASYLDLAKRSENLSDQPWLQLAVLRVADRKVGADAAVTEADRVEVRKRLIRSELDENRLSEAIALLPDLPAARPQLLQALDGDL